MSPEELQDEVLAGVIKLLTAMPLNIIDDAMDPDLNYFTSSGYYYSKNKAAAHAPESDLSWGLYVVTDGLKTVSQTYQSNSGVWWRSTTNPPLNWGDWKPLLNEPAMPLTTLTGTVELEQIRDTGIYIGTEADAVHAPDKNGGWYLEVVAQPFQTTTRVFQTYTTLYSKWWRSSLNGGSSWNEWRRLDATAMPLSTVTGVVDANQLRETGLYVGKDVDNSNPNNPYSTGDGWFMEVWAQSNTIIQIFMDTEDRQSRSSKDGGQTWTKWRPWQLNNTHMPTWDRNEFDVDPDLNNYVVNGFYMGVEPPQPAKNGPPGTNSPLWSLMVSGNIIVPPNYDNKIICQTYFDANGVWYRTQTNIDDWTNWVSLTSESSSPKAYGSAYRLGDAIIAKDHFIPFTSMGPYNGFQLDTQTGEVIVGQAGDYSVSLSLHLNNNQPASFAIAIDGNIPEHHPVLHYEHATSTYAGIQSAQVTGLIRCEAGQRIGVKNVTGQSVTLRHAVNGVKCHHLLTLTQVG